MKARLFVLALLFLTFSSQALDYTVTPTSKSMKVNVLKVGSVLGEWNNYSVLFFVERNGVPICVGKQSAMGIPAFDTIKVTVFGDDGVNPGMYEDEEFSVVYYLGAPNSCEVFILPDFGGGAITAYKTNEIIEMNWFYYQQSYFEYEEDTACVSSVLNHLPYYNTVPSFFGHQYHSINGIVDVDVNTGGYKTIPGKVGVDTIRLTLLHSDKTCNIDNAVDVITIEEDRIYSVDDYLVDKRDQDCDGFGEIQLDYSTFSDSVVSMIVNGNEEGYTQGVLSIDAPTDEYIIDVRDSLSCIHHADGPVTVEFIGNCEDDLILMSNNGGPTSIYFERDELVSIYTKKGILVHQFQGPGYWDGRKDDGQLMSIGLYVIYSETGDVKKLKVYQ